MTEIQRTFSFIFSMHSFNSVFLPEILLKLYFKKFNFNAQLLLIEILFVIVSFSSVIVSSIIFFGSKTYTS